MLPPLVVPEGMAEGEERNELEEARGLIERLDEEVEGAKDCLLAAKVSQAHHVNKDRNVDPEFAVGKKVMLERAHWRRDYMQKKSGRVAKFMLWWDGPYKIMEAYPTSSTYKLSMPNSSV